MLLTVKALEAMICQSVSGECSAASRENKTNEMLEIIGKGRDKTKSLKSGLTEGKEKWRGVICCVSTVNRQQEGEQEAVYHSLSLVPEQGSSRKCISTQL